MLKYCSNSPIGNDTYWNSISNIDSTVEDTMHDDWLIYAPEYLYGLDTHEWQTHGSCYTSELETAATHATLVNAGQSIIDVRIHRI